MKITIRKTIPEDAKVLHECINDKDIIKELAGYHFPCPLNKIEEDIQKGLKEWDERKTYSFTIIADEEIAGQIFLENPSKDFGRYEIGFYIGKDYWGKGIATEAIKQTVNFGFDKLKLYKIYADNDSDNPGSGRAMEKAGMKLEGILKNHTKKNGQFVDLLIWGISK